jgi:preprotein translocase subunit SecE
MAKAVKKTSFLQKIKNIPHNLNVWFFGIIKEVKRIRWNKGKNLFHNVITVIIFVVILVALFWAVDAIFLDTGLLK